MKGDGLVRLARIVAARGLRGEVRIQPYTAHPQRIADYGHVLVGPPEGPFRSYRVQRVHRTGPRRFAMKLAGVDGPQEAEALRGMEVAVERARLPETQGDEYYWHDLMGLEVVTLQGEEVGSVAAILETGANDVFVVKGRRGEVLIPAVAQVVVSVDLDAGVMVVDPPPGLLEANLPKGER